jgi:predicted GNAT family N-acyltransferase
VKIAFPSKEYDAYYQLRVEVFCNEQGCTLESEYEDEDISTHYMLIESSS